MAGFSRSLPLHGRSGRRRQAQNGSQCRRAGECPEWQRELTVNQPPHGFEGSSPSFPTIPGSGCLERDWDSNSEAPQSATIGISSDAVPCGHPPWRESSKQVAVFGFVRRLGALTPSSASSAEPWRHQRVRTWLWRTLERCGGAPHKTRVRTGLRQRLDNPGNSRWYAFCDF